MTIRVAGIEREPAKHHIPIEEVKSSQSKPSWQSRVIVAMLRLLRVKKQMSSAAAVQKHVQKLMLHPIPYHPKGLGSGVEVESKTINGWPVYFTSPSKNPKASTYVVFLHGGGYINEIVRAHWKFIGYLTREGGIRCIVPIYPLAPSATASEIVPGTGQILQKLMKDIYPSKVIVVGNSAGAALGLAATQWLRDGGHHLPDSLLLISPGGDFSIPRAVQQRIAAVDPVNDIPGAREAGRLYAGNLSLSHPFVSPLNGSFNGLPPMVIFSGTLDLFYPDCVDMAKKAQEASVPVNLYLEHNQPHNYAAMPTPEGHEARRIILQAIQSFARH